jgi:hypothetical protein
MFHSIMRYTQLTLVLAGLVLAGPAAAITLGQVDDFQTNKGDWGPASAVRTANGGPEGDGDSFLKYTSTGTEGPGNRAAVRSDIDGVDWAGNYVSAGVSAISLDVANNKGGDVDLNLRLTIGTGTGSSPRTNGTWYTTSVAVSVPVGADWANLEFDLTDAAMSLIQGQGTDSLSDVLAGVTQIRFISAESLTNRGDSIAATMSFDNITAIPEPSTALLLGLGLLGLGARRGR